MGDYMSTWNWSAERRTAIGDVANQPLEYVAERLLESRKRAFDAEQKAQQLQTELDALKAAHTWIKTSERMPDPEVVVLIISTQDYEDGETCTAKCYISVTGARIWEHYCNIDSAYVTHWQPLPEPPK